MPPGSPAGREPRDPCVEGLLRKGRIAVRVLGDAEVLELTGARVRRPAQDVGEPVEPLQERGDRGLAEVWVHGDRVRAEDVEQRDRLPRRGRADIPTLRVDHDGDVLRQRGSQPFQRDQAGRSERLEEREVRLHRGGVWGRSLEDERGVALDAGEVAAEALRQGRRIGIESEAQDAPDRSRPPGESLEVPGGHRVAVKERGWRPGTRPAPRATAMQAAGRRGGTSPVGSPGRDPRPRSGRASP